MRKLTLSLISLAAAATAGAGNAEPVTVTNACPEVRQRIVVLRAETHRLQRSLGVPVTRPSSQPVVGCGYARWVANLWATRATRAERMRQHRTLPAPHDWATAVRVVQRVYPGTESWLLSCSDAEGGHGPWVWYGGRRWAGYHVGRDYLGADTVGGWMQFRYSTFAPNWPAARADTIRRGFIVPDLGTGYGPWLEPLGQALTAAYMRAVQGSSRWHWAASVSRGCA